MKNGHWLFNSDDPPHRLIFSLKIWVKGVLSSKILRKILLSNFFQKWHFSRPKMETRLICVVESIDSNLKDPKIRSTLSDLSIDLKKKKQSIWNGVVWRKAHVSDVSKFEAIKEEDNMLIIDDSTLTAILSQSEMSNPFGYWNQLKMSNDQVQSQISDSLDQEILYRSPVKCIRSKKKRVTFYINKMKVLKFVKFHLKVLGCWFKVKPNSSVKLEKSININYRHLHIGLIFSVLLLNIFSTFSIYVTEVKTFNDFCESAFWASRSILSLALYAMFVQYTPNLVMFFNDLDEIVDRSKFEIVFSLFDLKNTFLGM